MTEPKIAVCVPTGEMVHTRFMNCLIGMLMHSMQVPFEGVQRPSGVAFITLTSSLLPSSRRRLVLQAIDAGATHVLFVDSDQLFPPNLAHELYKGMLENDCEVIACNVPTKLVPSSPTARAKSDDDRGRPYFSHNKPRYEPIWRIGTGIMLIDVRVFAAMPQPWFPVSYSTEREEDIGEDWGFCQRLEKLNFSIIIDNELSLEIGHIGLHNFSIGDIWTPEDEAQFRNQQQMISDHSPS